MFDILAHGQVDRPKRSVLVVPRGRISRFGRPWKFLIHGHRIEQQAAITTGNMLMGVLAGPKYGMRPPHEKDAFYLTLRFFWKDFDGWTQYDVESIALENGAITTFQTDDIVSIVGHAATPEDAFALLNDTLIAQTIRRTIEDSSLMGFSPPLTRIDFAEHLQELLARTPTT